MLREWRLEIKRHCRRRGQQIRDEGTRVKESLHHTFASGFGALEASFFAGVSCCCFRQRLNSASFHNSILSAELTTWSGVLAMKVAYFSTASATGSCSSY